MLVPPMVDQWPVVFLDRDGVINRMRRDHVKSWSEFELLPGVIDAVARISASGRQVIVLTNQSAIGRGLVAEKTVAEIHARVTELVEAAGGRIAGFLVCPHSPEEGCDCRKPAPGLFYKARRELGVNLSQAVMVGDQPSDIEAARAAGCDAIRLDPDARSSGNGTPTVRSLQEAADLICGS
jgi:histidinol-phosphate phosphatase family protein